jgi:transposase
MTNQLFAAALGIAAPWFVQTVDFDSGQRQLTIHVDFVPGSRFAHSKAAGDHKVHDTQIKRLRHLNADSGDCGQVFRLIADSDSDRSRTAFR